MAVELRFGLLIRFSHPVNCISCTIKQHNEKDVSFVQKL